MLRVASRNVYKHYIFCLNAPVLSIWYPWASNIKQTDSLVTWNGDGGYFSPIYTSHIPIRTLSTNNFLPKKDNPANVSLLKQSLPKVALPYAELMRLDKFSATWLLAWPCFWSASLAAAPASFPDFYLLALFGTGAIVMRSAGCIVNDMWDVDLDRKVERTKYRPLASRQLSIWQSSSTLMIQLSALKQLIVLLAGHGILGLSVLLQLNDYRYDFGFKCINNFLRFSKVLGLCSIPLVCTYPLAKRVTYWPQLHLGAAINWGALIGWSAVRGTCDWNVVLPLYCSGIFWTLIYDTIYACQDKVDDRVAGVKSTALLFGKNVKTWLSGFAVCQILCLTLTGLAADCGAVYYSSVLVTSGHLMWQISSVNLDSSSDCMKKFVSNKWLGLTLFSGIVMDRIYT